MGLETTRLPLGTPEDQNHVPILVSKGIESKSRIVVVFGERNQDLGVFSYRVIGDSGLTVGSALEFANAVLYGPIPGPSQDAPGLVITNPGQLLWYRGGQRAVTRANWANLPRPSAVHDALKIDENKNKIPGNRDYVEHIQYVFENVLGSMTHKDASFDIIGLEYTGAAVLEYLSEHCK